MDRENLLRELEDLREKIREIEMELAEDKRPVHWRAREYYAAYYIMAGGLLGIFASMASLLFNVVGAGMADMYPLQLIRVYLTFPLGDRALEIDEGLALAIGVCLYIGTGMLYGMVFHAVLTRWFMNANFVKKFVAVTALSILVWGVNIYGILSWLQPLLIDMSADNLIYKKLPPLVGVLTHIVFGWAMVVLYPLGLYVPYNQPAEQS